MKTPKLYGATLFPAKEDFFLREEKIFENANASKSKEKKSKRKKIKFPRKNKKLLVMCLMFVLCVV